MINKLIYLLYNKYKNKYIQAYLEGWSLALYTLKGKIYITNRSFFRNSYQHFFKYGIIVKEKYTGRFPIGSLLINHEIGNRVVVIDYSHNGYIVRDTNKTNLILKGSFLLTYTRAEKYYSLVPYNGKKLEHLKCLK